MAMVKGPAIYGRFPRAWVDAARTIAHARTESNPGRARRSDRGSEQNERGDVLGVLGERIAREHRPDLGVDSLTLFTNGHNAPKTDTRIGVDVKAAPMGRPRALVNQGQADRPSVVGIVIALVSVERAEFWLSPVIPISTVRNWPVFDAGYGDPAYAIRQSELARLYPLPMSEGEMPF